QPQSGLSSTSKQLVDDGGKVEATKTVQILPLQHVSLKALQQWVQELSASSPAPTRTTSAIIDDDDVDLHESSLVKEQEHHHHHHPHHHHARNRMTCNHDLGRQQYPPCTGRDQEGREVEEAESENLNYKESPSGEQDLLVTMSIFPSGGSPDEQFPALIPWSEAETCSTGQDAITAEETTEEKQITAPIEKGTAPTASTSTAGSCVFNTDALDSMAVRGLGSTASEVPPPTSSVVHRPSYDSRLR
ncbi:unnamed protein product, partial [Amoebophrya sp. A25]